MLHLNEDVNMGQSTNDVYPTALKIAAYMGIVQLVHSMGVLRASLERKAEEFRNDLKMGRTQLQDAVPMTLVHLIRLVLQRHEQDAVSRARPLSDRDSPHARANYPQKTTD